MSDTFFACAGLGPAGGSEMGLAPPGPREPEPEPEVQQLIPVDDQAATDFFGAVTTHGAGEAAPGDIELSESDSDDDSDEEADDDAEVTAALPVESEKKKRTFLCFGKGDQHNIPLEEMSFEQKRQAKATDLENEEAAKSV